MISACMGPRVSGGRVAAELGPQLDSYDPDSEEAVGPVEVGSNLEISEPAG